MTSTSTAPATLADITGTWNIDAAHSRVGFVARHAMVTKVRGAFNDFDGTAVVDGEDLANSSATLTIQVASIDSRNAQRDAHLLNGDFLDVDQYPEIRFVSTAIRQTSPTSLELTGNLSIKDVTRSVTVPFNFEGLAADPFGNVRAGFDGSVSLNRKDYGITWNAAMETGGVLISDKVLLEFEISAVKAA